MDMAARYPAIGQIRGKGLLWAIELVQDHQSKAKHSLLAEQVLYRCLEKGLSFKVSGGNVLSLYPPLIISKSELAAALDIIEAALI
jgi:4-aminobutyrate aminotransferase